MSVSLPSEFRDPIHHMIMEDPVQAPCGHIFERTTLQNWLRNQPWCPIDFYKIDSGPLKMQLELKEKITAFLEANPDYFKDIDDACDKWESDRQRRFIMRAIKILTVPAIGAALVSLGFIDWSVGFYPMGTLATLAAPFIPWLTFSRSDPDFNAVVSGICGFTAACFAMRQPCFSFYYMASLVGFQGCAISMRQKIFTS